MEMSANAVAFSIDSLMSSKSVDADHDQCHSAQVYSRAVRPKIATDGQASDCVHARGSSHSHHTNDPLVCRATSLLKKISVQDTAENVETQTLSTGCGTGIATKTTGIVCQQAVRQKTGRTDRQFSGQQPVKKNCLNHRVVDRPSGENNRRFSDGVLLFGTDYRLRDYPIPLQNPLQGEATDPEPPPGEGGWGAGKGKAFDGVAALDDPISKTVAGIQVTLESSHLWKLFNKCGTEMIVNRVGRRMFPCVVIAVRGMDPASIYRIQMELDASDRRRYKFINGKWLPVGKADPEPPNQPFEHPDSPNLGAFWMKEKVSFAKLKISNNKETGKANTVLHSMHKYTPRIIITKLRPSADTMRGCAPSSQDPITSTEGSPQQGRKPQEGSVGNRPVCIEFRETSFIAVTAYHSEQITQLKIQNNPFAKAFRDADVTAILQGAYVLSETGEPNLQPPVHNTGLMSQMHSGFPSDRMEWQNPSTVRQNRPASDLDAEYSLQPTDASFWREGPGTAPVPEFPFSPWSFDNVASLRPSGTYSRVANPSSEVTAQQLGSSKYHSHPAMALNTGTRSSLKSGYPERHRHSAGALHDALREEQVNNSLSHPNLNYERAPAVQPSTTKCEYPEFTQDMGISGASSYHPLRRVSSAAISRYAKRHSFPYFSPKKVLFLPRYRSADAALQKSADPRAHVPRRHSIIEGSPLFRASTGNLPGKMEVESAIPSPHDFPAASTMTRVAPPPGDRASSSASTIGSTGGGDAAAHGARPKKQTKESPSQPDWDPKPMNLTLHGL